jgi:GNAT superfamily N-acetyltransferase
MASPHTIRPAVPGDEHTLFQLITALARYEKLEHLVTGAPETLAAHLFGDRPSAEALLAERDGRAIGYALFFTTYSTFLTRPGLYLEDLFVLESERKRGVGRALLTEVKRIAEARGAGRLEWSVLDWNAGAIAFYRAFGAEVMPNWRLCRVLFPPPVIG